MTGTIERGREAFARQSWADACAFLAAGDGLQVDDLEHLAVAAYLIGQDEQSDRAWERAHFESIRRHDPDRAARCAVWLATLLMLRGEGARAGGWFARATRLVDEAGTDSPIRGYLQLPEFLEALGSGDADVADTLAKSMVTIASRFGDKDLLAFGMLASGQAELALGNTARGVSLLDEVMVAVETGEVSPIPAGIVYCAVIEACVDVFDLRRAAAWTESLSRWCSAQPDLVPYRGQCLVHRAQVLQAQGAWTEAVAEADRAREQLSTPVHPALGLAFYQQGELHRLRGELAAAELAYRSASEHGREPAPGLALLRLEQGNAGAAVAAIRRMVNESRGQLVRPMMLAAAVAILLAADDLGAARSAAEELDDTAVAVDAPLLRAIADHALGSVLIAEGAAGAALDVLRRACNGFRDLDMPHDAARTRIQIGRACAELGDHDAADLEFTAARATFERLGARPDLARAELLTGTTGRAHAAGLTVRECEVLRLVATGKSNREIAADLFISEHTVARHLQNIFLRFDLPSRAAATAYAYEHGLI